MEEFKLSSIEDAVKDFKEGKFVIVVDDEDRENDGDKNPIVHVVRRTRRYRKKKGPDRGSGANASCTIQGRKSKPPRAGAPAPPCPPGERGPCTAIDTALPDRVRMTHRIAC